MGGAAGLSRLISVGLMGRWLRPLHLTFALFMRPFRLPWTRRVGLSPRKISGETVRGVPIRSGAYGCDASLGRAGVRRGVPVGLLVSGCCCDLRRSCWSVGRERSERPFTCADWSPRRARSHCWCGGHGAIAAGTDGSARANHSQYGEHAARMRGHVVGAFGVVRVVGVAVGGEAG